MKVRAASIWDLGRLEELHRRAGAALSHSPPNARLRSLLSHTFSTFVPMMQDSLIFTAEEQDRLLGFIQATGRPSGSPLTGATSLQILNIVVEPEADLDAVAMPLIEQLAEQATQRGIERLFARLPIEEKVIASFRRLGFRQYATEHVYFADEPRALSETIPFGLHPARGKDLRLLYSLYRKVTPLGVAQMEIPNYKEWRQLTQEPILPLGRSHAQQWVVDRVEIVGWVGLVKAGSASRPHTLSFLTLPEPDLAGELADFALAQLGAQAGPAWSSLRHYDAHMIDALRGRGFTTLLNQSLMVKELALRAPMREKVLVPSYG